MCTNVTAVAAAPLTIALDCEDVDVAAASGGGCGTEGAAGGW